MTETEEDSPITEFDAQTGFGAGLTLLGIVGIAAPYFSDYLIQNPTEVPRAEVMAMGLLALGLHKMGVNRETIQNTAIAAKDKIVNVTETAGQGLHNLYTNISSRVTSLSILHHQSPTESFQPVSYEKAA